MKIFNRSFGYKDRNKINRALTGRILEPRAVSTNQSGVTTTLWALVTVILI
jgi:hypothetical protein